MMALPVGDGRQLEIAVSGPDAGVPVIFHHGTPGSAIPPRAMQRAVLSRGLRLVTSSRAGYGGSSRNAGRTVADVVPDVTAVLDHLGAERCLVAGWSGGGPHALATATLLPGRVAGALVIAGVAPYASEGLDFSAGMGEQNIQEFGVAADGEPALRALLERESVELRTADAAAIVAGMASLLPPVDVASPDAEFGEDMAANFAHGLRDGVDGWLDDDLAFVRPWGFDLGSLQVPASIWQGSEDLMVPIAHGRWLAEHVPGVTVHLEHGEGHLSIALGALDRMLDELVDHL